MFLSREILDLMKKTNALHPVQVSFSLLVYLLKKVKKKNDDSCHELSTEFYNLHLF